MTQRPATDEFAQRRKRARRTALIVGVVALAIYVSFILSGVLSR